MDKFGTFIVYFMKEAFDFETRKTMKLIMTRKVIVDFGAKQKKCCSHQTVKNQFVSSAILLHSSIIHLKINGAFMKEYCVKRYV